MKIDQKSYRTIQPLFGGDEQKKVGINSVEIIDQTLLPHRFEMRVIQNLSEMVAAIKTMQVRGAPLIGAAAAYGMALAAQENPEDGHLQQAAKTLIQIK